MIDLSSIDVSAFPHWLSPGREVLLIQGDCLAVLPEMESGSVDAVITSPPYNLKKKWWGGGGANNIHVELAAKFDNEWYDDEIPEIEYQRQQKAIIDESRRITRGVVCYNHKIRHAFKRAGRTFHPISWTGDADLWCEIIWDRGPGPAVNCRRPTMADERIFVFGKPIYWKDLGFTSIWKIRHNTEPNGHPCPFPLEIPARLAESFTPDGATILDPYLGSGTTGVACIRTQRQCIGIEIDPKYFAISKRRCEEALAIGSLFDPIAMAAPNLFEETQ